MPTRGGPTTYVLTCEFMLRNPSDYEQVRKDITDHINGMMRYKQMQVSFVAIEKKKED